MSICEGLRTIFLAHAWWKWEPDPSIITDGIGEKDLTFTAVRSTDGSELLVYFPINAAKNLKLAGLHATRCTATWMRPQDAARTPAGEYATGTIQRFQPPRNWLDALLVLRAN